MEKSYKQVSLKEAARILYLTKQEELNEIAKTVISTHSPLPIFEIRCFSSMDGN